MEAADFGPAPRSVGVGWLWCATVDGRLATARWSWPACKSVVEACRGVRKAARRRRYGGRGARSCVPWSTADWREVLTCCTWMPERRLRVKVVVIAMLRPCGRRGLLPWAIVEVGAAAPRARWCCCHVPGRVGGGACFRWRGRWPSRRRSLLVRWHGLSS
jgi:hypothetical protein